MKKHIRKLMLAVAIFLGISSVSAATININLSDGTKILQGLHVDYVHVLVDGKIIKTSTGDLANEIEAKGYEEYKK